MVKKELQRRKEKHACKCNFVSHRDPYLILGPFNIEIKHHRPFQIIIHEFFTEVEMQWMLEYSSPRLSQSRRHLKEEFQNPYQRKQRTVEKTVQTWFSDIIYNENELLELVSDKNQDLVYQAHPMKDPKSYKIVHPIMLNISKRIELVTGFNVTSRHGSNKYQVTNYGLGGLVETHMDPWGYEEGVPLVENRKSLSTTGDQIATFMGWLSDVPAGGGTVFPFIGYDEILTPKKGSAAFWISLSSCHSKDYRSFHGGCPILKGFKYILNKWIYSWDQWRHWPCYLERGRTIQPFK